MESKAPVAFPPLFLIRAAIFDLDGTLLDTETESTHAINRALAHYGAAITPDIKRAIIGMRSSEWSSYVIKALSLEGKMDPLDLVRQWEENLSARMTGVALMPGVSEAIAFFKKHGIPMAIATSSSPASVAAKRAAHPDVRLLRPPLHRTQRLFNPSFTTGFQQHGPRAHLRRRLQRQTLTRHFPSCCQSFGC